jgi:hypothetical protein
MKFDIAVLRRKTHSCAATTFCSFREAALLTEFETQYWGQIAARMASGQYANLWRPRRQRRLVVRLKLCQISRPGPQWRTNSVFGWLEFPSR